MTVHVFAGPTITADRIRRIVPTAVVHPPIRHGDLLRLAPAAGDTVVIIDGLWHQVAPVRHKEILDLLAGGVRVVGAASMGALRAAELDRYGMIGVGRVYQAYASGAVDSDDEVAVVHTPDGRPLSEALVTIRATLEQATHADVITAGERDRLVDLARRLPFQLRSWSALRRRADGGGLTQAFAGVDEWRSDRSCEVKRCDAEQALALVAGGAATPAVQAEPVAGWTAGPWRTSFVRYWAARFHGPTVGGDTVPFLAILQHQQLYDPDYPARWRGYVLSWIAGQTPRAIHAHGAELERRALATAAARGVSVREPTARQRGYWLTSQEISDLDEREGLLRILIRSARLDSASTVWPSTMDEAGDLINPTLDSPAIAAEAFRHNDRVARLSSRYSIDRLDPRRVEAHLASRWGIDPADRWSLCAAARDRGFQNLHGAVEVARGYYL
ncbi:MAG: hypothetical protein L0Y54_01520, partial [Sporichthyaceae bacterium]|nr:hypothetical protein [Sporichthyaceae bacterium]